MVDVPLGLLVNRVSVQRPALILCDADAPGAVESVERIHRDVPGGHRVDVVFIRERGAHSAPELTGIIEREGSGSFDRPVDDAALTRKVEALIGPPTRHEPRPRLAPGGRAPILVAATRRPFRYEQKSSPSAAPERPPSQPPKSATWVAPAPSSPPSAPGSSPVSAPDAVVPPPASLRREDAPPPLSMAPNAQQLPQARLSPELEMLLGRAEQRVTQGRTSVAPPSDRLSPEAELEAILPNDVLAALDEPLDLDDGDESDAGPSTHGGDERGSTRGTAGTGTKTNSGSKAPGPEKSAAGHPSAEVQPSEPGKTEPPPSRETEPPKTPPNMPLRAPVESLGSDPAPAPPSDGEQRGTAAGVPSELPPPSVAQGAAPEPSPDHPQQISTKPPRATANTPPEPLHIAPAPAPPAVLAAPLPLQLPTTLRAGEAIQCLAVAVRSRYTGAVAFEAPDGIRRIVFRDGDFVTAATSVDAESLVACLIERGTLPADASAKLGRKLPLFGRHAGAALIAHGYLQQDELWPVLRTHAEWLIGRIARLERGETGVEPEVPPRLATEPAVFGGATGAEVLVDLVRRVSPPDMSIARLGGAGVRLRGGPSLSLLGECALEADEVELVRSLDGETLGDVIARARSRDFGSAILALVALGVLEKSGALPEPRRPAPGIAERPELDRLDHEALRKRIAARRALVDEGDYFALLGVGRGATGYDVRRAYTQLREELDPTRILTATTADLRDDVDAILSLLDEAYEILSDDLRRERYRRALEASPA
ncbi:MAG: hypothetical protein K0R38_2126 [Polyangiaceae bacterium]|nr:hypothetical protein [Polyangiaceae bacterium]